MFFDVLLYAYDTKKEFQISLVGCHVELYAKVTYTFTQ